MTAINILYDCLLLLLAALAVPKLVYQWVFHGKYRESLWQRLGIGFPDINKGERKLIWVHAVSVGETRAVASLVKKIKKEQPETLVVLSCITETGFAEGERSIPEADYHVFLPFDFHWIVLPIVKRTAPDLVLLCETDFWYNFLKAAKREGAKIALVNGKLSARSSGRYRRFSAFTQRLFTLVDLFCLQSEHYRERFLQLSIPKDKIVVTGNLKLDAKPPPTTMKKKDWGLAAEDCIFVAGSTHHPEESLLLDALQKIWPQFPNLTAILVPRHPERFDAVANLLEKRKISYRRYSQQHPGNGTEKVILLDRMGLLTESYQLADLALVAGSFTPHVGGHNIIEPAWYGVPVLFGPYMHAQPELVDLVEQFQAGQQVAAEDLPQVLLRLLQHPEERRALGTAGLKMVDGLAGATNRTFNAIKCLW